MFGNAPSSLEIQLSNMSQASPNMKAYTSVVCISTSNMLLTTLIETVILHNSSRAEMYPGQTLAIHQLTALFK